MSATDFTVAAQEQFLQALADAANVPVSSITITGMHVEQRCALCFTFPGEGLWG